MDPSELAQKIHDRITTTQSDNTSSKKFLTWKDLSHPGFKGRYDSYMSAFVAALKELVTDPVTPRQEPTKADVEQFVLTIGARRCYCCSNPFMPSTETQFACNRCLGD